MNILIVGACGHMGREVARLCADGYQGICAVAGVDAQPVADCPVPCASGFGEAQSNVDCIVDFSNHSNTQQLLDFAVSHRLPLVLATTGQTPEEREAIRDASKQIPLFFASNFSLGIAMLIQLAKQTLAAFPDAEIEIIEKHHDRKMDAPSGTALTIADELRTIRPDSPTVAGRNGHGKRSHNEIGIHAVRLGNIVGEHEVIIATPTQTITLKHEAHSRALFAEGALTAAAFLQGKCAGLYDMHSLLTEGGEQS